VRARRAGFAGTATVLAGEAFGIPLYGTMAHSFIEEQDDEAVAFELFARARPDNVVLLLDTYDTEAAARKVVALAPRLKASGIAIRGLKPRCLTVDIKASSLICFDDANDTNTG